MADWDEKFLAELAEARRIFNPRYVQPGRKCEDCGKRDVFPEDSYWYCKECFDRWQRKDL